MKRKLIAILLVVGVCLLGTTVALAQRGHKPVFYNSPQEYEKVTGKHIDKFNEAPMLKVKVAAGELPPVEERLPQEPVVVQPVDKVGRYGGRLVMPMLSPSAWFPASQIMYELGFVRTVYSELELIPNIFTSYEFSPDGKVLTLHIRKGIKWSDGVPFTADDLLFQWYDVMTNKEITPVMWKEWKPVTKVEKVDDYTVSYYFNKPYWTAIYLFSQVGTWGGQGTIFRPKHALTKYHIKYNPDAEKLAKEAGYDHWWQLFNYWASFASMRDARCHPDIPTLGPWQIKELKPDGALWERNPYYFKVDVEGNQLPYIDEVRGIHFSNMDTLMMRTLSGDYDFVNWGPTTSDYRVIKENEEKGGYVSWLAPGDFPCEAPIYVQQNYKPDPVIAELLRNKKFKHALSLAINRDELNEVVAFGQAIPCQATCEKNCSFYKEEWSKAYAEYNPEKANKILDEIGLDKRDSEGYRLKPDGKPLTLIMDFPIQLGALIKTGELVREYWEAIGLRTVFKTEDWTFVNQRNAAGENMFHSWPIDGANEVLFDRGEGALSVLRFGDTCPFWNRWYQSGGVEGEEPPEELKRLLLKNAEAPFLPKEERNKIFEEIMEFQAENLFSIGTIGYMRAPLVRKKGLCNVDENAWQGIPHAWGGGKYFFAEQFFWEK